MSTQTENVNAVEQYEKTKEERKLMNKTKKELISIIFRKDDTERNLRKELNELNLDFNKSKNMIAERDTKINNKDIVIKNLESELKVKDKVIAGNIDDINNWQNQYEDMRSQSTTRGIWNVVFCAVIIIGLILHFMF